MAVYTHLSHEAIEGIVAQYGLGELVLALGIAEGVENSNFLIEARRDGVTTRCILTVYEKRVKPDDLPFFLELMNHLASKGIACPVPLRHAGGDMLLEIDGKYAAMVTFLTGSSRTIVNNKQIGELGRVMAQMHLAAPDMTLRRENDLSLTGWLALSDKLGARLDEVQTGLHETVNGELDFLHTHWPRELPVGVIHADLFPNNVFFEGDRLSGVIDFYFACEDMLAYELAICLNCWCFEASGEFNVTKAARMMKAYEGVRNLSAAEKEAMPVLARGAALRFLLTRAHDWIFHDAAALVTPHDPLEYLRKLQFHQGVKSVLEYGLH